MIPMTMRGCMGAVQSVSILSRHPSSLSWELCHDVCETMERVRGRGAAGGGGGGGQGCLPAGGPPRHCCLAV